MNDCEKCRDLNNEIDELFDIFQFVYNSAFDGLNSRVDNQSALNDIVSLVKDYIKEGSTK